MNASYPIPKVHGARITEMKAYLAEWRSVDDFAQTEFIFRNEFQSPQFFRQPGLAFLREAYIASIISRSLNFTNVRLSNTNERAPDFFLKKSNEQYDVEVVEVLEANRRRGTEPWGSTEMTFDPVENWIKRAEQIPNQLRNFVLKKMNKRYSDKNLCLVINLNIGEWGIRQKEIEGCLHESTAVAQDKFLIIWLVWKDQLFELWRNGIQVQKTYNIE